MSRQTTPIAFAKKLERLLKNAPEGLELVYSLPSESIQIWKWSEKSFEDRTDSPVATFPCPLSFSVTG